MFQILEHLPYPTYLNFSVCSLDCFEKEYWSSVRIVPYFHFCHGEDGSYLFQLHNSSVELEHTVKPVLSSHSKRRPKIGFQTRLSLNAGQKYCRMLQGEHSAILSTCIKLPFVFKTFVLSIFEWRLKTGFTISSKLCHDLRKPTMWIVIKRRLK